MKMKIVLGAITAAMLMVGCTDSAAPAAQAEVKPTITEESLGLRKTDLYSENTTVAAKTTYGTAAAGGSAKFERAFDNAPPMIPHDTEGMLPITMNDNQCTGCHMPEVAPSMGATPIPASHFASFRPVTEIGADDRMVKDGASVDNTSDKLTSLHTMDTMNHARYNCSQCHAPQSTGDLLVENNFRPDFQSESMKSGSSLLDTLNTGVK
ncbi:MAG: nitrate reductase cytochrome c-type subunit [Campylobacterota bacterium]|nr:nitrate reductase cytochrome c-type subunit [Campylobacterota bacterium]